MLPMSDQYKSILHFLFEEDCNLLIQNTIRRSLEFVFLKQIIAKYCGDLDRYNFSKNGAMIYTKILDICYR